jgi:peptidoglycan/xylan/chitin deacetylase (PgdA/CDA1 family)
LKYIIGHFLKILRIISAPVFLLYLFIPFFNTPTIYASDNLIANPSLENSVNNLPVSWYKGRWGTNTTVFSYPVAGHNSANAVRVDITGYTTGDAKWYFSDVPVTPSTKYTFSNFYKSNVSTYLTARYTLSNGTYKYPDLALLPAATDWTQANVTFTVPTDVVSMTVFHLINRLGYVVSDDYELITANPTPTVTPSVTPTPVITITPTPTTPLTPSPSPAPTITPTIPLPTPTEIPTPTATVVPTPTLTNIPSPTPTTTPTPLPSPSITPTNIPSPTPTGTLTPSPTPPQNSLIGNYSVEQSANNGTPVLWFKGGFGTNDRSFVYPDEGYNSAKGIGTKITKYTSGDTKWYFADIPVNPGEFYQLTENYKSTTVSYLTVRFTTTNNSFIYKDIAVLPSSNNTWTTSVNYFRVPDTTVSLTIFHLIKSLGSLTTDNYLLTKLDSDPSQFGEGMVSVNFDDGLLSSYTNALPVLTKYGIKSTQYILSGYFGNKDFITVQQMLEMQALGHEIGSHTRSHSMLTQLTESQMRDEIIGSLNDLRVMGADVTTFSYPFGDYNQLTDSIVHEAGYLGARTSDFGNNTKTDYKYLLKRYSMQNNTTLTQLQSYVNTAITEKHWVILLFHGIDLSNDTYSVKPQDFDIFMAYLKQSGVKIVTTNEGLMLMSN